MATAKAFLERMLQWHLNQLALTTESDMMAVYGPIRYGLPERIRNEIEGIRKNESCNNALTILLDTRGGLVGSVEKSVRVIRHHYESVNFIVPSQAMSAGTLFALSGDKIYMNYYSQLGPIDPQLVVGGKLVPVLGYLEKYEELNEKSRRGTLTELEGALAREQLALVDLHQYEQARDRSIELVKEWLSTFKFKNWDKTESKGAVVTLGMKQKRAEEIAQALNDTKRWHAHSRGISMKVLQEELRLKIEDMRESVQLREIVKGVHEFIVDFMETMNMSHCIRTAHYNKQEDTTHEQT